MAKAADELPDWAIEIDQRLSSMKALPIKEQVSEKQQRRRMYGLPASVYKLQEDFLDIYKPRRVSLGPLSADMDRARELKEASLVHFLRRSKITNPLQSYLNALREVVDELRDAYDGLDQQWRNNTQGFLQMMLLDGCFVLEFIGTKIQYQNFVQDSRVNTKIWDILENHDETKLYLHDFLLLENQLPMKLLLTLLSVGEADGGNDDQDLRHKLLNIGEHSFGTRNTFVSKNEFKSSLHLLDVYRRSLVHRNFKWRKTLRRMIKSDDIYNINNIPSATELERFGIGFITSDSTSLLDIKLQRKTLKLPQIMVDGSTKSTFLNLIAFEKLHQKASKREITSYMYFMGCLVQSAEDASLLQSRGIIVTAMPAAEVAHLFKRVTKGICPDRNDPLIPEFNETLTTVRERYNKIVSNEWRKGLFQTYLKTPWKIMSVMAALLLLTLTILQTVFTVLSYVRP